MRPYPAGVGFDRDALEDIQKSSEPEQARSKEEQEKEFGDLLFALVNYARHKGINPEGVPAKANLKFKERFKATEQLSRENNRKFSEFSLEEQESPWQETKRKIK